MTVLAIANAAGSAGKTTTAVTLAALIAQSGFSCDLIDFDPQGNATHWTGVTLTADTPTIADVLDGGANLATTRLATIIPGLSVLPATPAGMEGVEARLSRILGAEQLLRLGLEAADQPADHTIIDCPGTLGILTVSSMVAADQLLTVAMPTVKELAGLPRITDTIDQVRRAYRPKLTLAGVVPCVIPPRSHGRHYVDAIELLRARWGGKVAPPVRKAVRVPESYAARQPLPLYDPGAGVTDDYRAVLAWLRNAGVFS